MTNKGKGKKKGKGKGRRRSGKRPGDAAAQHATAGSRLAASASSGDESDALDDLLEDLMLADKDEKPDNPLAAAFASHQSTACASLISVPAPLSKPTTFVHFADLIHNVHLRTMPRVWTHARARLAVRYACIFMSATLDVDWYCARREWPAVVYMDMFRKRLVVPRGNVLLMAHGPIVTQLGVPEQEELKASVTAHSAMLCAQEHYAKLDARTIKRLRPASMVKVAPTYEPVWSVEDLIWLDEYVKDWLKQIPLKWQPDVVRIGKVDGLESLDANDRFHNLLIHFRRGYPWPRTYHGTRVIPFGAPDLLDKTDFDEGETTKSCLTCQEEFTATRAWREHLLMTTKHEVYLCCGRQFVDLETVLGHFLSAHKDSPLGTLGELSTFILHEKQNAFGG